HQNVHNGALANTYTTAPHDGVSNEAAVMKHVPHQTTVKTVIRSWAWMPLSVSTCTPVTAQIIETASDNAARASMLDQWPIAKAATKPADRSTHVRLKYVRSMRR